MMRLSLGRYHIPLNMAQKGLIFISKKLELKIGRFPQPVRYLDTFKPVTANDHAFQRGMGACLIHDNQPIAIKSFTDTEKMYAYTQNALSAIMFTFQCFCPCILRRPFIIENTGQIQLIRTRLIRSSTLFKVFVRFL